MSTDEKTNLTTHIQLAPIESTSAAVVPSTPLGAYDSDSSVSGPSRDSFTMTHTMTMTNTYAADANTNKGETIGI